MEKEQSNITVHTHNTNMCISGEIIPRHKVKGDSLFHFDHYESTTLAITTECIRIEDHYYKTFDSAPDTTIFVIKIKDKESIARLLQYFDINTDDNGNPLQSLYEAMESYARKEKMSSLDLFGKLFKDIEIEFKGICHL